MKYICISNYEQERKLYLTIGRIYDTIEIISEFIIIINDRGYRSHYSTKQLIPLDKYRKERISKLLKSL